MALDLVRTLSVLALIAGLLLAPIEARLDIPRGVGADVVGDQEAFTAVAPLSPVLNETNNYTDDAMTVTNNNHNGTSLDVTVTSDSSRFKIRGGSFTLSPSTSDTAQIEDTDLLKASGTYDVDVTVKGEVVSDGSVIAVQTVTRTVTLETN